MVNRILLVCFALLTAGLLGATAIPAVKVEIDTFYVFTEDISLKDARAKALQWTRESALNKALPVDIAITSLTTDMYVEKNDRFDENTARSIFMMSSSAGRFIEEKLFRSTPIFDGKENTYKYSIAYQASIQPMEKAYNSALDMTVELSNTLLQDGAEFELEVTANQDGYLYIFDFLADNSVALVYPNLHQKSNTLQKNQSWKQHITAVAEPTKDMTIETMYFVFSTAEIAGWENFRTNNSYQDLVFSAGDESFILFQKWLGRSNPATRVEKMAQLHIISKK